MFEDPFFDNVTSNKDDFYRLGLEKTASSSLIAKDLVPTERPSEPSTTTTAASAIVRMKKVSASSSSTICFQMQKKRRNQDVSSPTNTRQPSQQSCEISHSVRRSIEEAKALWLLSKRSSTVGVHSVDFPICFLSSLTSLVCLFVSCITSQADHKPTP
jgi:hypothetical protein